MENLATNNLLLADRYLMDAARIYPVDPLLLNEIGVLFYQVHEYASFLSEYTTWCHSLFLTCNNNSWFRSYPSALNSFGRALETGEKLKMPSEDLAPIYNNLAHAHRRLG
jgi:hypothetical protein